MTGDFIRINQNLNKIKDKDHFSLSLNIFLNYWEMKPAQYEAKLQELSLKDVQIISCFVPWSHLETDIHHCLKKFVKAVHTARLNIRIFAMPELGIHYPNCGFPKDLLSNHANLATDRHGKLIYNHAAPNIFALPSFSAPEVLKRFGNYLIKLGSTLAEVFSEVGSSDFCEIVVSNSLFNYYRNQGLSLFEHGDYSAAHVMAFRDFLDREYKVSGAASVINEQFKMQLYESFNRHRFFTHVEKLLREKIDMVFARKNTSCTVRHLDLFNPECDPAIAYHSLLTELFDYRPSIQRFYETIILGGYRMESIFFGNSGIFRRFTDQEKSFLLLAALIHAEEVGVVADDLFKLSPSFQRKLKSMVGFLDEKKFKRKISVLYYSASKFSMEEQSFQILKQMASGVLSVVSSLEKKTKNALGPAISEKLILMDPKSIVRTVDLVQLLSNAQTGKVVAIPRPTNLATNHSVNYTSEASDLYEKFKKERACLKINIGLEYEVYEYHLGHVVFFNPDLFWVSSDPQTSKEKLIFFFKALLGLSEIHSVCSSTDSRLNLVSYSSMEDSSERLLFVINPTIEKIETSIVFQSLVSVTGIPTTKVAPSSEPIFGKSFELTVPPLGVLSMQVREPGSSELERMDNAEKPVLPESEGVQKWI